MSDSHNLSINKTLLLVFHGGMVLYLLAHNLGLPLVRNLATGNLWYYDLDYFWPLQVILLFLFFRYDFQKPKKGIIPLLIYITLYSTFMATIQIFYMAIGSKITLSFFGPTISILSIIIFLMVFFAHFKQFFFWKSDNIFRRHILAIMLSLLLFVLKSSLMAKTPKNLNFTVSEELVPSFDKTGCKGSKISFTLPLKEKLPNSSEILPCGFNYNLLYLSHNNGLEIKNSLDHPIHVRLEFLRQDNFIFERIQVVKQGEIFKFPDVYFTQDGIYKLKTPSNQKLGIQIILKGDLNKLEQGNYLITPKTIEVGK